MIAERWQEAVSLVLDSISLIEYGIAGEFISRLRVAARVSADRLDDLELVGACLGCLGLAFRALGVLSEAVYECQKSLVVFNSLLESDPDNVVYQSDVAGALNNLGNLLSDMGRPDDAKQAYDKAKKISSI